MTTMTVRQASRLMVGLALGWSLGALIMLGTSAQAACGTSHFKFDTNDQANNWLDSQLAAPENDDNWFGEGAQDNLESQPCADDFGVEGGGENDVIRLGSGVDSGSGGAGRDDVFGGTGNDLLQGGNGDDELKDQEGSDADYLQGHDGDDLLDVADGDGADEAHGGPQTDTCGVNPNDVTSSCELP
jgi:hypothetical protein